MKPKPRIYKGPDGWTVELPTFGFAAVPSVRSGFATRQRAGEWLAAKQNIGAASQHVERTTTPEDRDLLSGKRWPVVIR